MSRAAAEADRQIGNLCQIGVVTAIDNGTSRVRVRIGDLDTAWVPVLQIRSGTIRLHWMPSVGEQVTVYAPSGDMARAFVGGSLPIDGNAVAPNAASPTMDLGGGTLRVIGKLYIDGDVEITGKIDVAGNVTSAADVRASGKSLVGHVHGGVTPGGGTTGVPI
jgi:phage baseplate assembly protein gpV